MVLLCTECSHKTNSSLFTVGRGCCGTGCGAGCCAGCCASCSTGCNAGFSASCCARHKAAGAEPLKLVARVVVRNNKALGIHENEICVRQRSLRSIVLNLVTNPKISVPNRFFWRADSAATAALIAADPPNVRKVGETFYGTEEQELASAAVAHVETRPDFKDLAQKLHAAGKRSVVVPTGVQLSSDGAALSKNGKLQLRPVNVQLVNHDIDTRQLPEAICTLGYLQHVTFSQGRSQDGAKTAESYATEDAKAEGHRVDNEVLCQVRQGGAHGAACARRARPSRSAACKR